MKQPMARVVSHEQIAHGIYELTLFTPIAETAEPGQFVHVKIPGGDATLRCFGVPSALRAARRAR